MRLVGPNCLGVLNTDPHVSLNATLAGFRVPAGRLAICSESGAIGIALLGHAAARRLGVSSFASLGQRADVSTNDLLEIWEEDSRTAVLMLYVETVGNPERFARIARRVAQRKPILAIKGHRRPDPTRSEARSHTVAALRGDAVVDGLLYHGGVQRFRTGEEMFNAAEFYDRQPLPLGRQIGIVSNSVGIATLAADACATRGLVIAQPAGRTQNPLVMHIRATKRDYVRAVRAVVRDPGVDALMAFYVDPLGGDPDGVLEAISRTAAGQGKPVVACVVTAKGELPTGRSLRVPNFRFPESCADVLARAAERRAWLSRPLGEPPRYGDLDPAAARELIGSRLDREQSDGPWLASHEAEVLLATHGLACVPSRRCEDADRAVAIAEQIGGPIALKARRRPPAYAGDIDAVLLGLEGEAAVRAGWRELERRVQQTGWPWIGAIVQRLMPPGADLLVGTVNDPEFGRVMAVGLGGRHGGLPGTAAFRLPPNTDVDADELINASEQVTTQLDGSRGLPRLDRAALRELVLRFALLLRETPEIVEADLNPVRCMANGCVVLDMQPADRTSATNRARQDLVIAPDRKPRSPRECAINRSSGVLPDSSGLPRSCHRCEIRTCVQGCRRPGRLRPRGLEHAPGRTVRHAAQPAHRGPRSRSQKKPRVRSQAHPGRGLGQASSGIAAPSLNHPPGAHRLERSALPRSTRTSTSPTPTARPSSVRAGSASE